MRRRIRNQAKDLVRHALRLGLLLTDTKARDEAESRVKEGVSEISHTVARGYDEAADRLEAASEVLRGKTSWPSYMFNFMAGIGVGVGLGMLFAPAPGAETRDHIRARASRAKDRVTQVAANVNERVQAFAGGSATGTEGA